MTGALMKRGNVDTEMHTEGHSMRVKAEIGVMQLEAKEGGLEQTLPPALRWLDGITYSKHTSLGKRRETVKDRGSPMCRSSWGRKESDTTERLSNSTLRRNPSCPHLDLKFLAYGSIR